MADKTTKFVLDLDIKEFTEKGLQAKGVIESLSDKENLSGLMEGLATTTTALGAVGLAAFAFKKALDFTVEAEQIRKVEEQFGTLAQQAGISAKELKSGMESASKGLVTTGDLLQIANKAIIAMGSSAAKLPQVMELARKATQVFGGDVKQNFDNLSTALANGNARMLKQYGILVDVDKATREYAKANGLAANELSEAGRRQAIMNAALEQGKDRFKNVNEDLTSATNTLTLLKNTLSETAEIFILAFEKTIGPAIRSALQALQEFVALTHKRAVATLGEGAEQAAAQVELLERSLTNLNAQKQKIEAQKLQGIFNPGWEASVSQAITTTTQKLETLRAKHAELRKEEQSQGGAAKGGGESNVNQEVKLANARKFQEALTQIEKEGIDARRLNVQSFDDIDKIIKEQKLLDEQIHQQKLAQIRESNTMNEQQKMQLMDAENKRYMNNAQSREIQLGDLRKKLLDQYQKNSTGTFDGIGRAFKANAAKQSEELKDFGKQGQAIMTSFQTNAVSAFTTMGAAATEGANIAEVAAKAVGATILGTIGDKAIADGSYMMLSGIFPPNPVAIGAGAGLIALGGALKSVSSGMLSSMRPSSGSGSAPSPTDTCAVIAQAKSCTGAGGSTDIDTGPSLSDTSSAMAEPDMTTMEKRQRAVTISIAGNYFETDSTRRQLMEMVRQESDATDFKYDQIGAG